MAPTDETLRSVDTLAFGTVGVGGAKTLTFVVTNKSYPHGSQNITISLSGYFTFGAGDDSFTLADYDDQRTIEVTYSPEAVQNDDATISFTTTATYAMANVAVTAEGVSCTYSLPPIYNNPAGVMKIDLIINPLVPALTIPQTVKIVDIGELVELIDVEPGIVDVQNLDIELAEDYSVYPAGFWYSLIQGYPDYEVQFKFILEEEGVDTFFFWGKIYREDVQWPEHYISTAEDEVIRTVSIKLVSLVHSLKDVPILDAITEMKNHAVNLDIKYVTSFPTHSNTFACVQIKAILASIASLALDQAYDEDVIQVRGNDIQFGDGIGGWSSPMDFYITTRGTSAWRGYIEGETDQNKNPLWWGNQFSNAYNLLSAIALNFGWVVRHYFGLADGTYDAVTPANNLHRLEFLTRGTCFTSGFIAPEEGITESTLHSDSILKKKNIRVTDIQTVSEPFDDGTTPEVLTMRYDMTSPSAWSIDGAENIFVPVYSTVELSPAIKEPPKFVSFDLDIGLQFVSGCWTYNGFPNLFFWDSWYRNPIRKDGTDGYLVLGGIEYMRFWDYEAGAWVELSTTIAGSLNAYFNRRFSPGRKQYERQYGSLKFTEGAVTSHVNLKPMKRIQINDQLATENYYATEVRKDFKANTSTVLWIQE